MLRAWADGYDVFKREAASTFVASNGGAAALGQLGGLPLRTAVSGSFAAVRLAPVAAPSMLVVYCEEVAATAQALGLLVADEGANVTLLRAAGFELALYGGHVEPGVWTTEVDVAGEPLLVPVDLIVPEAAATGGGARRPPRRAWSPGGPPRERT